MNTVSKKTLSAPADILAIAAPTGAAFAPHASAFSSTATPLVASGVTLPTSANPTAPALTKNPGYSSLYIADSTISITHLS